MLSKWTWFLGEWGRGSHYAEQKRFRDWEAGLRSDTRQDRRRRNCQHFEDSKMEPNRKIGCSVHRTTAAMDHSFWIGATHRRLDAAKLRREKSFQEWSTLWNHETKWLHAGCIPIHSNSSRDDLTETLKERQFTWHWRLNRTSCYILVNEHKYPLAFSCYTSAKSNVCWKSVK